MLPPGRETRAAFEFAKHRQQTQFRRRPVRNYPRSRDAKRSDGEKSLAVPADTIPMRGDNELRQSRLLSKDGRHIIRNRWDKPEVPVSGLREGVKEFSVCA